ncbi:MAG: hypothetical protein E5299_00726 [Burkholderia gladioli]|nr:MAG: hypothetical protein E5299_00726 [Burkholderia gladioli]
MTNQNVADGEALAKLLEKIPRKEQIDVIDDDGAYDTMPCGYCCTQCCSFDSATRGSVPLNWPADTPGAA